MYPDMTEIIMASDVKRTHIRTVKPVFKDHPRGDNNMVFLHMGSLLAGSFRAGNDRMEN